MNYANARAFEEWFHAEYLRLEGPIDPHDQKSRERHRRAKSWAHSAWICGRADLVRELQEAE